jgi:hypothetical protein
MIKESNAMNYCKDDISKIENYEKAMADTAHTWDIHHRLELTIDGEFAHTAEELQRLGMYYQRPYFELIFLTRAEHRRLHNLGSSPKTRQMMCSHNAWKGKGLSIETRQKISEAMKGKYIGRTLSVEIRKKMSEHNAWKGKTTPLKGKPFTAEHRQKISEAAKARWARYRQEKANACL